jgi:hypothetical protein
MKKLRALFLLAAFAVTAGGTSAAHASAVSGYIRDMVQIGTRLFIYVGIGTGATDNCAPGRSAIIFTIDPTTPEGKSYLALALSAKAQGTEVYVSGNSDCWTGNTPNNGVSESLAALWVH